MYRDFKLNQRFFFMGEEIGNAKKWATLGKSHVIYGQTGTNAHGKNEVFTPKELGWGSHVHLIKLGGRERPTFLLSMAPSQLAGNLPLSRGSHRGIKGRLEA